MRFTDEVLEFAKELYLTPNINGEHNYSLKEISQKIEDAFNVTVSISMLKRWAKQYGWEELWETAVKEGITKALVEQQQQMLSDKRTKEEMFKELLSQKKHDDFAIAQDLKTLAYNYIRQHGFSSVNEALKALELGFKYTQEAAGLLDMSLHDVLSRITDAVQDIQLHGDSEAGDSDDSENKQVDDELIKKLRQTW